MDRIEEIRQHCETGGPIRRIDMKYLLSEVDRLQAALSESQRRERAAVEQIEQQMIFDAQKGCEPCEICSNADKTPCEECNPKWRGLQAGKEMQ